jgi:peptide/nickel transport system substrate-binding protein
MRNKKLAILMVLSMIASMALAACGATPQPQVVTVPVEVTKIVEKQGTPVTIVETRIIEVTAAAPAAPTAVPPTATPEPKAVNTVVFGMQQEPDTLHPLITSMTASAQVLGALNVGCMAQNEKAEWINLGCDGDIPTLENGGAKFVGEGENKTLQVTHKIRQGWRWTDGTPVTPKDVIYAWKLAMDPQFQIPARSQYEKIYDIVAVDDQTFTVQLMSQTQVREAAAGTLKGNVDFAALKDDYVALGYANWEGPVVDPIYWTVGSFPWVPAHILESVPAAQQGEAEYARQPIGDSAYVLKDWKPGQEIVLEKSDLPFPMGDVKIKTIVFRFYGESSAVVNALKNGEVDAVMMATGGLTPNNGPDLDAIEALGVYKMLYMPGYSTEHIDLNTTKFPLDDVRVRQALYYAMDRQALNDSLYFGKQTVADLPIPKGLSWAYTDNYTRHPYDLEKAKQLLKDAGWDCSTQPCSNAEGKKLEFTLMTTDRADRQKLAQAIQQMWKQLNAGVNLQFLYGRGLFQSCAAGGPLYCRSFDAGMYTSTTGDDPAFTDVYSCKAIPTDENAWSGQNWPGWCNKTADEAIDKAEKDSVISLSREKRLPYYETFFQEYAKDVPIIPIFAVTRVGAVRTGWQNYKPGPTQFAPETWNFWEWELSK